MPHFNLIQHESRKSETPTNCKFAFGKSANGNLELTGGQADGYSSHFCEYLNSHIPDSWQTELYSLYKAETDLLQKRRDFAASCRAQVPELFGHLPAKYQAEYPELFI
jgi:hypothetical protein